MTQTEPVRRLRSVRLLPDLPVTVVGRGQVARTAAEILGVVGAEVRVIDASAHDLHLRELAHDALVVCDLVEDGLHAGLPGGGGRPLAGGVGDRLGVRAGRPDGR